MKKGKNILSTYLLLFFILISVIISFLVLSKLKEETPTTPPIKTKAANITYKRLIALNPVSPTSSTSVSSNISPTSSFTPSPFSTPTPLPSLTSINFIVSAIPTETFFAYNNQKLTSFYTPTKIVSLPQSGIFNFSLFFIILSSLLIFLGLFI